MKFGIIKSEKDVKKLLLEQLKKVKEGDKRLIMLSPKRFEELENRVDVRKEHIDWCDYIFEGEDIKLRVYENDRVFTSADYGYMVFSQIAGVYILKQSTYFGYVSLGKEATKSIFIE